ncbi:FERM and PDZ domain-containing protein 1 isoform X2 [Trichosurus vulpecula]|uniref:FERM and PDZ domain-containing protein 1 isoform X2 n=1 Tax=Trichosurus vulpecula TaxID=9337 RepID=UPI00186AE887|nr:FERM and PDZ domain-containing protein 1 isoform X2 [Trichosurus vulpecula]
MKCSSALRLAALHIQERIYACAQPQKISLKYIEKDWGIENFISPTLLRNMRGKDIKKAISFHMKRNQSLLEPRQKQLISAAQLRLNYLQILGELKTYGGKIFNATLMLQDRESYIALLVGAKYGISQIINSKLNIMSTLAEFANISQVELMEESEKVSMVKIYLQDVKVTKLLTLLLESNSAKDLACLIAGYYRLFVDSTASIFLWGRNKAVHRISAEEGYESRACSDSEESSEVDSSLEFLSDRHPVKFDHITPLCEEEEEGTCSEQKDESVTPTEAEKSTCNGVSSITDTTSEGSDSANTESRGCKTSGSSDSMDALEEDDLDACSASRPEFFHFHTPNFKEGLDKNNLPSSLGIKEERGQTETNGFLCLLELSQRANTELQKTEFSNYPSDLKSSPGNELNASTVDPRLYDSSSMEYYSLCSNVSPASILSNSSESSSSRNGPCQPVQEGKVRKAISASTVESFLLNPFPSFEDTSSDDEFYDAADKLTPSDSLSDHSMVPSEEWSDLGSKVKKRESSEEGLTPRPHKREHSRRVGVKKYAKTLRKRRSFLQTDYTSQVTFPLAPSYSLESVDHMCYYEREPYLSFVSHSPTVSSLQDTQGEPGLLETKALGLLTPPREAKSKNHSSNVMEMEPETMETKSVIDSFVSSISAVRLRIDPENKENSSIAPLASNSTPSSIPHHLSSGLSEQNDQSDTSEKNFQLQDGNVRVCKDQEAETQNCPLDSCNIPPATKDSLTVSPEQQEIPGVDAEPQFEIRFRHLFENPIQETIQKCLEPLFSSGDQSRNSECAKNSGGEVPFSAIKDQVGERLVQTSFGGSKETGFSICDINRNSGISFQEEPRKDLDEGLIDDTSKKSLANVRLPFELNGLSGEIAPLSKWQTLGTKTNEAPLWHMQGGGRETALLVSIGQTSLPPEQQLLLSEKHLDSGAFNGHLSIPLGLQTFLEGSSVPEHLDDEMRGKAPASVTLLPVDFNQGQIPQNPPSCHLGDAFRQGTDHNLKKLKCPNYFPSARGDILEMEKESFSIVPPSSKKPLLCLVHKNNPNVSTNRRSDRSLDFAGMKDVISPKIGMEQCSCQLSYATCFRGSDPDMDDENSDLETTLSSAPLTTPPSSGSQYSAHWRPELTRSNSCSSSEPHLRNNCLWSEYYTKIVKQLKAGLCKSPDGFCQLLDHVVELQDILEQFGGNGNKHPQDKCAWYFSENRNCLCTGSQKLMSSCQHVIKINQSPEEMQSAVQETFRNLIQLVGLCFQFTNCGRCVRTHRDVMVNLKDVVCAYYQFVQAAKLTCERGYRDLSVKLLARQCTALTAAVFCLTQKFRASMAL